MINIKKINLNTLYYIAFILTLALRWFSCSAIIKLSPNIFHLFVFFIVLLYSTKLILEQHTKKEYLIIIILSALFMYIYIKTDMYYLLTSFLAFYSIKKIDIKKIIRIDIIVKLCFIISHALLYLHDWMFNYDKLIDYIFITNKGMRHTLYFANPNTVGVLLSWLIIDYLHISKRISGKKIIATFIIMLIGYKLTLSRTALYAYLIYVCLIIIKNYKIVDFINKHCYYMLAILSYCIVKFLNINSSIFIILNKLFSNRLLFSIEAFDAVGLKVFPTYLKNDFFELYIIDNFYVKCLIYFGIITLIIAGIPQLLIPKKMYYKEKVMSIVSSVYLFFENVTINIGYAIPYLIIADILFNKKCTDKNN